MINYTVSWSSGSGAFGWPAKPVVQDDPLVPGVDQHLRQDLVSARDTYLEAMRARPNRALAFYNFACLQVDQKMGLSSIPFFLRASLLEPDALTYQVAMLFARLRSGDLDGGDALLATCRQRGLGIDLSYWQGLFEEARQGNYPATQELPSPRPVSPRAIAEPPDRPLALLCQSALHASLAMAYEHLRALFEGGHYQALVDEAESLLNLNPQWWEGHHLHGRALCRLGRWEAGAAALSLAAQGLPGRPDIWDHWANALDAIENFPQAHRAYQHSLALNPLWFASWNNAADAAIFSEESRHAFQYAYMALTLAPDNEICRFNFARAAQERGNFTIARQVMGELAVENPEFPGLHRQLGKLCLESGDHAGAQAQLELAVAREPGDAHALSHLVFVNNYLADRAQAEISAQARRFGELISRGLAVSDHWPQDPDPNRCLRIGFVSGDLRQHSVGLFLIAVIEALSQTKGVEITAYPTTRMQDSLTDAFRAAFHHWLPIAALDDDEAAARVRADGIDILVDLSGHTALNRLGLFARKPAPVQVTWLGYFGTTGLKQIDYLLAGPWDVTVEEESYFTETIWRLPHTRLCFSRPEEQVAVAYLPALTNGYITFGCFNDIRKLNDRVIRLWAALLLSLPQARLFLKTRMLDTTEGRRALTARFLDLGVAAERLIIEGPSSFTAYLASYGRVDIALDPFPYTGGTTSAQALWMGVPILTMAGDSIMARQGEAMLRTLGLEAWIATSEADYVERALHLAQAIAPLQELRAGLRQRLERSPLMDAAGFASDLESAFRSMWRQWCQARW